MVNRAILEMTKGRWREFCREPSALFFVVFMPIVWMVLLGLAFSNQGQDNFKIGIDPSVTSESIVGRAVKSSPTLQGVFTDRATLQQDLKRGRISLILQQGHEGYQLVFDSANPQARASARALRDVIQVAHGRTDPVLVAESTSSGEARYIDFLIPGLLALSLLTTSLFGTGMTIVVNRRENLLKRYLVTPMRASHYILSHILGRYLIVGVELAAVLGAGYLLFRFHIGANWLSFLVLIILGTGAFTAIGILCGSRSRNSSAYNGMVNLIVLPMMILAGVWFSKSHFPEWLSAVARFLPLTALVDGLRDISLEGASLGQLGFEIAVLAAYGVGAALLSTRLFKWY